MNSLLRDTSAAGVFASPFPRRATFSEQIERVAISPQERSRQIALESRCEDVRAQLEARLCLACRYV